MSASSLLSAAAAGRDFAANDPSAAPQLRKLSLRRADQLEAQARGEPAKCLCCNKPFGHRAASGWVSPNDTGRPTKAAPVSS